MQDSKKDDSSKSTVSVFNLDDSGQMPSLSRLLNRKSLTRKSNDKTQIPKPPSSENLALASLPPPLPALPTSPSPPPFPTTSVPLLSSSDQIVQQIDQALQEIENSRVNLENTSITNSYEITDWPPPGNAPLRPIVRTMALCSLSTLLNWEVSTLLESQEPMAESLKKLFTEGLTEALYFHKVTQEVKNATAEFLSHAQISASDKHRDLWAGSRWSAKLDFDCWSAIQNLGYYEFPLTPDNHYLEIAFDLKPGTRLSLVRIGAVHFLRGIILLFSPNSLPKKLLQELSSLK